MKTLVLNGNKFASRPLILSFVIVVSVMFSTVPVSVAEFEVGTQFGFTRLIPADEYFSSSVSILQAPSGDISSAGASPYLTFFPNKHFAVSPAFNLARVTTTTSYTFWGESESESDSASSLYLGSKFHFFLRGHAVSNPYLFGKASITTTFIEDRDNESALHIGMGVGYQWHIAPVYFLRLEGQYHRVIHDDEHVNGFSVMMGIGVRFGGNKANTSEVPNTQ